MRSGFIRGVVAPKALPSLRPYCPGSGGVCGRLWCCSCSQLCCAAPRTKCLPRLFLLMLLPIQTRQSFGLTKPPVSQMIFFLWMLKFTKQEEVWGFFWSVHTRGIIISSNVTHIHTHMIRLTDSERGWQIGKADSKVVSEPLRVMSMFAVEVMGLRGFAGQPLIFGLVLAPPILAADKMFWWEAHVNSQ